MKSKEAIQEKINQLEKERAPLIYMPEATADCMNLADRISILRWVLREEGSRKAWPNWSGHGSVR